MSSFGSCRNCGTAWDTGDEYEGTQAIGDRCPGCELRRLRRTLRELNAWLKSDPEYCPICGTSFIGIAEHAKNCDLATFEPFYDE